MNQKKIFKTTGGSSTSLQDDKAHDSCNKYTDPQVYLPRHADDVICTFVHSSKIKFSELHGKETQEHVAEPNSLYTMSRDSQGYWQHQIENDCSLSETSVRYRLTFKLLGMLTKYLSSQP